MASKTIVKIRNLTKIFVKDNKLFQLFADKRKNTAVNNISFEINKGEIVGLLGPNGAGKTTTIQMLLGLITPTSGSIEIFGKNFKNHRKEILKEVNFSSTYTNLPWRLTVWENLYVAALLYGVQNPKQKILSVTSDLKLTSRLQSEVGDLSSGWVTRLQLARTFINNPKFILLDEPTASLDPESADQIRTYILKYRRDNDATVLWTSHNMSEVEEVCDRVIFLKNGKIIAEDTPAGLANRIKKVRVSLMIKDGKKRVKEIVKTSGWVATQKSRFTIIEITENKIPDLLHLLSEKKIEYSEISIDKSTLEDYFLTMARKDGDIQDRGDIPVHRSVPK